MSAVLSALTMAFYAGILLVIAVAARRRDYATVVNGTVSFAVAILPPLVELGAATVFDANVSLGVELPLWLALAGFLHTVGMLGPYDTISWWDTLTHLISGALVGALAYAGFLIAADSSALSFPVESVGVLTVVFAFAVGVFWELIELVARDVGERFDIEPVLVVYGWRDTAVDLAVDVLAAILVVLLDARLFVPIAERFPGSTTAVLGASVGIVVAGTVVLAGFLAWQRR